MQKEQEALKNFINLHAHKATICKHEKCVYLTNYRESGIPLNEVLSKLKEEDIIQKYDLNHKLTQWVMNQLNTYDPQKEVIIGLDFGDFLLTHVIKLEADDD